jgi:GNAT superfamily N-acetyltransferase
MPESLRVRLLGENDADRIAEFIRAAEWDPSATVDDARKMLRTAAEANPFQPGVAPPRVGVFVGERLAAYLTSIPTSFWNGKEHMPGHWLKGFWVLPEYQNGPVGFLLLKEMLRHVGLAASLPAAPVPRKLSVALGMTDLGAVSNYIQPLRPSRILRNIDFRLAALNGLPPIVSLAVRSVKATPLRQLIGALVYCYVSLLGTASTFSALGLRGEWHKTLPDNAAVENLWERARQTGESSATRSATYLHWRYEQGANGQYSFASVRRGKEIVALAVLAPPQRLDDSRLAGLAIGSIVDLVLDPGCRPALPKVLQVARRWARAARYDALLLTASNQGISAPLLRAGYFKTPGNIHMLLRDKGGKSGLSSELAHWNVTRGDAWSDHL